MTSIEAQMVLVPEIREFIVANFLFGRAEHALEDDESFLASGIIDSTGVLELIGFLEKQYGITVENAELLPDNLDSVSKVASFVRRKLGD
ncbi:MAG TPA: acyl carrier protein [Vicinamibacterales bacterium]|nr:acyl carrier protein [Vicinamibacterales bacterium]